MLCLLCPARLVLARLGSWWFCGEGCSWQLAGAGVACNQSPVSFPSSPRLCSCRPKLGSAFVSKLARLPRLWSRTLGPTSFVLYVCHLFPLVLQTTALPTAHSIFFCFSCFLSFSAFCTGTTCLKLLYLTSVPEFRSSLKLPRRPLYLEPQTPHPSIAP